MAKMYGKVFNCSRGCCYKPKSIVKRTETQQWIKDYQEELDDEQDPS